MCCVYHIYYIKNEKAVKYAIVRCIKFKNISVQVDSICCELWLLYSHKHPHDEIRVCLCVW